MPRTTLEDLERRRGHLGKAALVALGIALFAAAAAVLLLQPGGGSGPLDVHIPDRALPLFQRQADHDSTVVRIAGGQVAVIQNGLSRLLTFLNFGALIGFVWALAKRRKGVAKAAIASVIALSLFPSVSPPIQMNPPRAVSVSAARSLLIIPPGSRFDRNASDPAMRYMRAQVAFIDGDRATASRLSLGLHGAQLASPIEGPFRLQFLQGQPALRSTVCYRQGCLPEPVRARLEIAAVLAAGLALVLGGSAAWLRRVLGRRCERIAELQSSGLKRKRALA